MKLLSRHPAGFLYYLHESIRSLRDEKGTVVGETQQFDHLVFLDRDGVINVDSEDYIKNWNEFVFCGGSLQAIRILAEHRFLPVIISNQSGINRGIISLNDLEELTIKMLNKIEETGGLIGAVCYCPHKPDENCQCRKPGTLMMEFACMAFGVSSSGTFFIGDRESDVLAGLNFGVTPVWIKEGSILGSRWVEDESYSYYECNSLSSAIEEIVLKSPSGSRFS